MSDQKIQASIESKVQSLFEAGDQRPIAEKLLGIWIESHRLASSLVASNMRAMLLLILVFTMLASATASELTVFGLTFKSVSAPLALSYSVAAFLFYRVASLFAFSQMTESAMRAAYFHLYADWQTAGLTDLGSYPLPPQIETALANVEDRTSIFAKTADITSATMLLVSLFGFVGWFTWGAYMLLAHNLVWKLLSIGLIVAGTLLVLRGTLVLIQASRR